MQAQRHSVLGNANKNGIGAKRGKNAHIFAEIHLHPR